MTTAATAPVEAGGRRAEAVWFGPAERPLFGWLHVPAGGAARGAVVLCGAFGLEAVCAHRAFRHLAERFAAAGVVALRFDYDGMGDSAGGAEDPDRVASWEGSVRQALSLVRQGGAGPVAVVGMRMGATVAACALAGADPAVDGLLLWDPCASGRSYLREQQALGLFSLGGEGRPDGSVEVPGIVYEAATVKEMADLVVADAAGALGARVLALVRPQRPVNKALRERLEAEGATIGEAAGQDRFLDVEPFQSETPTATLETVFAWVSDVVGPDEAPFAVPPAVAERRAATVGRDARGRVIVERTVSIGPLGLFGIVAEPGPPAGPPEQGRHGPTVILLNAGIIDHVGPSRLWVDFARRWAAGGLRVLRFDLSGLGDSPVRPGQDEDVMYPPEAFDDLAAAVAAMAPADPTAVTLTGLCAGGYHSIEGGIALGVGAVCVINPILTARPAEIKVDTDERTPAVDPRRQATTARRKWVRALPAHDLLGAVVDRLPDGAWWFINKVAVGSPPSRIIEKLVDSGVDTYVVCGENEARVMRRGQAAAFRRLALTGRFHLEVMPGIDHELFARASRDRVGPVVTERILGSMATADRLRRL